MNKQMTLALVLDRNRKPLMPCHPARARKLLAKRRAAVYRLAPFTIILKDRTLEQSTVQPVRVKIDPGSKETGVALVREDEKEAQTQHALAFFCIKHRGASIRNDLKKRSALRRGRRGRNLRYRAPRFLNRRRPEGWIAPSLAHRVQTTMTWVRRLSALCPIAAVTVESVRFDMQKIQNPEISGVEYQRGTLFGCEVREYLLEKFNHKCAYCGARNEILNIEHVVPKSKGGSNRVSNLVIACKTCNDKKDAMPIEEFLAQKASVLERIRKQLKTPLADAAAVNATRNALVRALRETGLSVETGTGGQTKFNRQCLGIPKEHWLDALCTGRVNVVTGWERLRPLLIACTGRGQHRRTRVNAYGFPICYFTRSKRPHGIATGDRVKAVIANGKYAGTWSGRASVNTQGTVTITTNKGKAVTNYRNCQIIQRNDGYGYSF